MTTMRKWALLCALAALLAVNVASPAARADELRLQDKTILEGNKGRRGPGRGGRGGRGYDHGRRHGNSGWAWAGFGAAIGLGVLAAVTDDGPSTYAYVEPSPVYEVYPGTTYYYAPTPGYPTVTYAQPTYVQPNYGQTYAAPQQLPAPPPCNVCQ